MADQPAQLNWTASLYVAHPSLVANKGLQGDKILLPQSALEQLLAASTTSSSATSHTFTAFDRYNPYTHNGARQGYTADRETYQQLPHPLMFQLVNQKNGNAVFAGIREFSASEGEVALSAYLLEALGIQEKDVKERVSVDNGVVDLTMEEDSKREEEGIRVTVKARQLPKGTYVRLRPLEAGYNPDDWKSLLERELRENYTTLTKDSVLSVRGVKGEEFRFLVDKSQPEGDGICVVDTDLEVDIEALNEEQARETLRQIAAKTQQAPGTTSGSSLGRTIDIWKEVEGQVLEGDYVDYDLPSWDRSRALSIELSIPGGEEVDLFVSPKSGRQRAPPRDSEHVFGDFSSPKDGVKRIILQPTNVELEGAESLMISVHGYSTQAEDSAQSAPRRYTLRAKAVPVQGSSEEPIALDSSTSRSADEEQCRNCLQWVPKRTIVLHENFCRRNNILCPQCKNVFHKSSEEWANHWHCPMHPEANGSTPQSKAKHDYIQHTSHTCPSCGPSSPFTFPSLPELARHRTTVCPGKLILCQFCHLEVPQEGDPLDPSSEAETVLSGLTAHERADGARTTDCHLCGAIVRLRDMAAHTAHHEMDKVSRPKPEVCRDELCGRTLHGIGPRGQVNGGTHMGQGPGNDLGLCSLCFAPLYVSMHDPEGKALRRRIERRYLAQLMTGCGKKWCMNEWCKTGRANQKLEKLGGSAAVTLPLIKPLLEDIKNHGRPMHFCVDEASQRRKKTAEMLAAEGIYELEWCIAALEAERGDLTKARGWLQDWAPTKVGR
ncbi:ubiquitin fusion degradation protein UFD1-domain-containing protein [Diplogelasinospora grovesii]|uniref:Ubiquitin fusion degradation protein UFD1-domain-containing protein n=1 Tax=Diplogelasinospora grovesii TaxID=303347 RepID=A0AAN6S789_9PEZI|nr:ubiquitin fusion degradation protein UFD1-domain-containing protein [Diplogelasinospora grovesii]